VRRVFVALTERAESLLEVNLGSIQKDPEQRLSGTEEAITADLWQTIQDLSDGEALVIWTAPE